MRSFVVLFGRQPLIVWHDNQLGETLASFRKEKSHIAVVRNVNDRGLVRFENRILFLKYLIPCLCYNILFFSLRQNLILLSYYLRLLILITLYVINL